MCLLQKLDPGAAVALGAPLLVRMFVPLWVVNATPLPVAAWVVPIQAPPPPSERDAGGPEGGLVDAADSIRLKTLDTESVQSPQGSSRRCGLVICLECRSMKLLQDAGKIVLHFALHM